MNRWAEFSIATMLKIANFQLLIILTEILIRQLPDLPDNDLLLHPCNLLLSVCLLSCKITMLYFEVIFLPFTNQVYCNLLSLLLLLLLSTHNNVMSQSCEQITKECIAILE